MSSERILAAEIEQLKGYIAMSEVNCNAAYNDLQKDRDVTKAKLFISDEKLREAEVEVERLRKALALAHSMILGGEQHTEQSKQVIEGALGLR